jgi:hypothetical protein
MEEFIIEYSDEDGYQVIEKCNNKFWKNKNHKYKGLIWKAYTREYDGNYLLIAYGNNNKIYEVESKDSK